jgi:UDP-3-O-[3-hydroxymyristoyl] glucosamine N-acyltransferase
MHPSAVVEGEVAAGASIGPNVWIGPGAAIGEGSRDRRQLQHRGRGEIGADSRLAANVAIYPGSRLGARCLVHSGAVIGADGFGFAREAEGAGSRFRRSGVC